MKRNEKQLFATMADFMADKMQENERLKGFLKARYIITGWLQSERLKRLVYSIKSPQMLDREVAQAAAIIEKVLINWINKNVEKRLQGRYIADIQQACNVVREG